MAIDRPGTIGDASGTDRSEAEDAKAKTLLFREEWARWEALFGVARPGEESRKRRRCGQDDRGAAVLRLDQAQERQGVHARSKAFFRRNLPASFFKTPGRRSRGRITTLCASERMGIRSATSKRQRVLRPTIPSRGSLRRALGCFGEAHTWARLPDSVMTIHQLNVIAESNLLAAFGRRGGTRLDASRSGVAGQ